MFFLFFSFLFSSCSTSTERAWFGGDVSCSTELLHANGYYGHIAFETHQIVADGGTHDVSIDGGHCKRLGSFAFRESHRTRKKSERQNNSKTHSLTSGHFFFFFRATIFS
jgi:hypothetical protein